jgi:hypothetical protein
MAECPRGHRVGTSSVPAISGITAGRVALCTVEPDGEWAEMSGWVTFWTAVGAVGTCAAIFVGLQNGGSSSTPTPTPAPPLVVDPEPSADIATVRYSDFIYDDSCSCKDVGSLPAGAKIRLICETSGAQFSKNGRSSTTWYQVAGGYVSEVVVKTSSRFNPDAC